MERAQKLPKTLKTPQSSSVHQPDLQVEWVPIDSIKRWEGNPRRNDRAAEKLAATIKANGFRVPIIVWRENMTIYAGNTRHKAAKLLNLEFVPVHFQDFESEAKAVEFALADNRLAEFAEWDMPKLGERFNEELETIDVDAAQALTGFTQDEIKGLRVGWKPEEAKEPQAKAPRTVNVTCPHCQGEIEVEV